MIAEVHTTETHAKFPVEGYQLIARNESYLEVTNFRGSQEWELYFGERAGLGPVTGILLENQDRVYWSKVLAVKDEVGLTTDLFSDLRLIEQAERKLTQETKAFSNGFRGKVTTT